MKGKFSSGIGYGGSCFPKDMKALLRSGHDLGVDLREAPSRVIVDELLRRGASIRAYDPVAMDEARRVFGDLPGLSFASHQVEALRDADALLIATEWREFKSPDFEQMRTLLKQPLVFDGRNLFDPMLVSGLRIEYYGIGRGEGVQQASTDRDDGSKHVHLITLLQHADGL